VEDAPSVLVVEFDSEVRGRLADWLDGAGFEVLMCPGPSEPDYRCLAGRAATCPLAAPADLVVLDLWLASDAVMAGTSSFQLLDYYISLGKPVIALDHDRHERHFFTSDNLTLLEWPVDKQELIETVRVVLQGRPQPSAPRPPARRTPPRRTIGP
jgi:DNA-binding response OmpR family regulator